MESSEFEKKIFKAAIINTDDLVNAEAHDAADARMTESEQDRSGNRIGRMFKRIWKHNLAQEWYRNREISRVKKEILETDNIYVGEKGNNPNEGSNATASKEALQAIIERFTSEYEEEMLNEEEYDSKHALDDTYVNTEMKALINRYAGSAMSEAAFEAAKDRILSSYDEKYASKKSMHADNLLSIANQVKEAVVQGTKIEEFEYEVQITLGKARESLSTEAHQTSFDKVVEKMQNSKVGKYIANEPVALGIAAGLWDAGRTVLQKTGRSKALQWTTFGVSSLFSGGISAMKERARTARERAQHQRETAKGMEFKKGDKRREEMALNSYETRNATGITQELSIDLAKVTEGNLSEEQINEMMGRLADVEARIKLNNQESIDLITYDKFNTMEKDRKVLAEKRAELKIALRNSGLVEDFDTRLASFVETQKEQLLEGERGIEAKDEIYRKLRNDRAKWAFVKTTLASATIGTVFQEGKAFFDSSQDGVIEGAFKHGFDKEGLAKNGTALEALRRYFTGDHSVVSSEHMHEEAIIDNTHIQVPEGVTIEHHGDTFSILHEGKDISGPVPIVLDEHGNLSPETQSLLAKHGITSDFGHVGEKVSQSIHESATDYVNKHAEGMTKIHRELWYDNNTPHPFDKNELRTDWGGNNGTGIDSNGNYVFNVSRMTADGSVHGAESINAAEQIHKGGLKMLFSFSKETQHQVFEVKIDSDGNAIIDPNSPLGKLMFTTNSNGHAVFTGKFAEVAQSTGTASDGGENFRILGTHVGPGKETINTVINTDTTAPNLSFHIPNNDTYDVPFAIPIVPRTPLEKGEYKKDSEVAKERPTKPEEEKGQEVESLDTPVPSEFFDEKIAEGISYDNGTFTGPEQPLIKNVDHVYAFTDLDRNTIDTKLKDVKNYKHPEVLIFETDKSKREDNLKKIAQLKKFYPKVKFTYVGMLKADKKIKPKLIQSYTESRLKHIFDEGKVGKKLKFELQVGVLERPVLGPISPAEYDRFMDTGDVSTKRLEDIAEKIKRRETLSLQEQSIYGARAEAIEDILKK
jgi:hypothetical protein